MFDSVSRSSRLITHAAAVAALALLAAVSSSPASAQKAGPTDERATQVLQGMSDYLSKAETASFRVKTFFDQVRESGIEIKRAREASVFLKRPDGLYVQSVAEDGAARTVRFDGSKLTVWLRHANEVMELDFDGTTDALLDELSDKYQVNLPVADLLFSDVSKALSKSIISSEYLGLRTVDGVKCHQLSFESTGADWQIWIEADATPLPRRFVVTYVGEEAQPQFLAQLDQWSIGAEMDASMFKAAVPESAKKVPFGKQNGALSE